jgi:hypothetical protein
MVTRGNQKSKLSVSKAAVLRSESSAEFELFRQAHENDLKPHGIVEEGLLDEIVTSSWEDLRYQRTETAIINAGMPAALLKIFGQLAEDLGEYFDEGENPRQLLAARFCTGIKSEVLELLGRFGLDESAVEAQAIRDALPDLEPIRKLRASAQARRDRALACLAAYRECFSQQSPVTTEDVIEAKDAPRLTDQSESGTMGST